MRIKAVTIAVVLGALGWCASASADATGQISGTVTGAGTPLGGICVEAIDTATGSGAGTTSNGGATDANGAYTISGLPAPGGYDVFVAACQGQNYVGQDYVAPGDTSPTTVAVQPGQTTSPIDINMAVGGIITGRVTDAAGNPVASLQVAANNTEAWTYTDSNGDYALDQIPAGSHIVDFNAGSPSGPSEQGLPYTDSYYDNVNTLSQATPITSVAGQTVSGIDAIMYAPGSITGTVYLPGGAPAAGIQVTANEVNGDTYMATTAANGTYTLSNLPAGAYTVYFESTDFEYGEYYGGASTTAASQLVTVKPGQVASSTNITLVPSSDVCQLKPGCPSPPATPTVRTVARRFRAKIKHGVLHVTGRISDPDRVAVSLTLTGRMHRHRVVLHDAASATRGRVQISWRVPRKDRRIRSARVAITIDGNATYMPAHANVKVRG